MDISPEANTGLKSMEVEVEARWVRSEVTMFEVGLLITKLAANREMEKYIEYLKVHSNSGKTKGTP
jgi:hypothetical protein